MNESGHILKYTCPKCGNRECNVETVSTTGSIWSRLFNIQLKSFSAVICTKCTYTELYRTKSSKLANVFDFMTG